MAKLKERDPVIDVDDADDMDPADEEHSYDIMSEETIKEIVGACRSDYFFDAAKDYALRHAPTISFMVSSLMMS